MLASHEQDVSKPKIIEMARLSDDLRDGERGSEDGVIPRESAVGAVVHAFIRNVEWREQTHGFPKVLQRQGLTLLCHRLQLFIISRRDEVFKFPQEWRFLFRQLVKCFYE